MRLATTLSGRAAVLSDEPGTPRARGVDVARASAGRYGPDGQDLYLRWAEFCEWAPGVGTSGAQDVFTTALGNPVPRRTQVFAIGLNYRDHAAESGLSTGRRLGRRRSRSSTARSPVRRAAAPAQ